MVGIIIGASLAFAVLLWGIYALIALTRDHATGIGILGTIGLVMGIIMATQGNPVLIIALSIWFFCTLLIPPLQINTEEKKMRKEEKKKEKNKKSGKSTK